MSSSGKLFEKL